MENELHFLVDVNLPKFFRFFNTPNFSFVVDLNAEMSDRDIWNYAIERKLVILTKDTDFYDRFLISEESPKIVHFQLGNMTLRALSDYFDENWNKIVENLAEHKFIIVKIDKIILI